MLTLIRWVLVLLFGRDSEGEPNAWLFTQDLNKGERRREGWLNVRWSIHVQRGGWRDLLPRSTGGQFVLGKIGFALSFSMRNDSENTISAHVCLPFFALYLGCDGPAWLERLAHVLCRHEKWRHLEDRELSLRIFSNAVWWSLWMCDSEHKSTDPWWRRGNLNLERLIFGKTVYAQENMRVMDAVVPMPEGAYPATVELYDAVWTDRFRRRVKPCGNVKVDDGIPHAGKGENSWDCGEDATYSAGSSASTPEEAIASMVESVLGSRRRYDGKMLARYPSPTARHIAIRARRDHVNLATDDGVASAAEPPK